VPYTQLTRRAYVTTPGAVKAYFLPPWRCMLVAMRRVRGAAGVARAGSRGSAMAPSGRAGHRLAALSEHFSKSPHPPSVFSPPAPALPQANVLGLGADVHALADAMVRLHAYFQTHDWDLTWKDPQVGGAGRGRGRGGSRVEGEPFRRGGRSLASTPPRLCRR
jgi:hypothetical protein